MFGLPNELRERELSDKNKKTRNKTKNTTIKYKDIIENSMTTKNECF